MNYKLIVFVPRSYLKPISEALFAAGAGRIGNYDHCMFYSDGIGTFRPLKGARPYKGKAGRLAKVKEDRLEIFVPGKIKNKVIAAMKKAHPYESPAYDVIELAPN
ncbi:MAG TPA: hypothetical protein VMD02_03020 [Candidatus Omnitrophota bacterium]|nr:hypothetical protein [Candidatus Omnitrophota bacterium]